MRGGWAIWLVSVAGSVVAHLGLVTALSGMTLEPPPPPLADLYVADAASEAPLEVEAVVAEETLPLEAEPSGDQQLTAADPDPQAVTETPAMNPAEAVSPAETEAAAAKDVEPRLSPVEETATETAPLPPAEDAAAQTAIGPQSELPEAERAPLSTEAPASPEAETSVQAPELAPAEDAASAPLAVRQSADQAPAEPAAGDLEPDIPSATKTAAASPVASSQGSAEALDPAADAVSSPPTETAAAETDPLASSTGKVDASLTPRAEVQASDATQLAARTEAVAAAPAATAAETPAVTSAQAVVEAGSPAQPAVSSGVSATPKEPIGSATADPQEQKVAALPPVSELPLTRRERIGRFLREDFDGGACLFVEVAGPDRDRPRLNGFVTEMEAIPRIGNAFRRSVGVDPQIAMRRMMEAQCPAVDFIGKLKRNRVPQIVLRLASDVVRGSDLLVGRLTRLTLPYTLLFIVDDDGIVHNLTGDLLPDVDGQTFAAEIHHTAEGKSRNQLLVAVSSTVPLQLPGSRRIGEAAPVLRQLQADAAAKGATLALGYATFRVE